VVFVDSSANTWSAVKQLTEELATARDIHKECAKALHDDVNAEPSEAVRAALTAVTSERAILGWKRKCRDVFGVGFAVNLVNLAQMGASEARMAEKKRGEGISQDLMTLFTGPV
jgi:hypothetical protein